MRVTTRTTMFRWVICEAGIPSRYRAGVIRGRTRLRTSTFLEAPPRLRAPRDVVSRLAQAAQVPESRAVRRP
eukprot:10777369-Lingulodinium_polyedra.AAC.1